MIEELNKLFVKQLGDAKIIMFQHNQAIRKIIKILAVLAVSLIVIWLIPYIDNQSNITPKKTTTQIATTDPNSDISDRISDGNHIFVNYNESENNKNKEFQSLKKLRQFEEARNNPKFKEQGSEFCADPETLIYLNNSLINQKKNNGYYTIAVVAPLDYPTTDVALQVLRGIAQAQDEINKSPKKINGKQLKVIIARENENENEKTTTQRIARYLVGKREILGVIGHFSTDATKEAVKIYGDVKYNESRLVSISPTSTGTNIANNDIANNEYFFRTVPENWAEARGLVRYMRNRLRKTNAAIIYNSIKGYSENLKEEFEKAVIGEKGKILKYDIDHTLIPLNIIQEAKANDVDVLMFAVNDESIQSSILKIIPSEEAQRFHYLGGDTLYQSSLLTDVGKQLRNMVIAVPWYRTLDRPESKKFVENSYTLWCQPKDSEEKITWRTATTYDATNVLIEALKDSQTREEVKNYLKQRLSTPSNWRYEGVTGPIKFTTEGDLIGETRFVRIHEEEPGKKYVFKLEKL